ncbi:STAS domain-containing protein [Streptomyces sp. NPDC044780]|uniref:STAS domain-containing protein n=1 Tax=Streptomyces luomodiensis TaxID=3026192 RepID=A0ABY9UXI2_9ACTN|nr:STAS domain-containing protein [Streptomyces sp. SCA4-21]WNE96727.1 STAS domain-containing protein [Streptomyces sp. SCA4-21]
MHAREAIMPESGHHPPHRPMNDAAPGTSADSTPPYPSALLTDSYSEGPRKVVMVRGEVDYETAPALTAALREALRTSADGVDLDLDAVRFWDCSALNALLRLRREALAHGKTVTVRSASRFVRRVLTLTGTSPLFRLPGGGTDAVV